MFFPLHDHNPTRSKPVLTYALIASNVLVHVLLSARIAAGEYWLHSWYGLVPSRFLMDPAGEALTVVSSMFMHGDWIHLASNMWFLRLFGDNLEDTLGRSRYLAFYLANGLAAALTQLLLDATSSVPMVGASGAIAGIVGGYMLLYPRAPILALNMVPLLWPFLGVLVLLPASAIAGVFFVTNVVMAYTTLDVGAGVAFFAHIGGFLAGLWLVKPLLGQRSVQRRSWQGFRVAPRRRRSQAPMNKR